MQYIIADKTIAENYGFNPATHLLNGSLICLNEKEVLTCPFLKGTLKTRVKTLKANAYNREKALEIMNLK